jgi:hypothetical protein
MTDLQKVELRSANTETPEESTQMDLWKPFLTKLDEGTETFDSLLEVRVCLLGAVRALR